MRTETHRQTDGRDGSEKIVVQTLTFVICNSLPITHRFFRIFFDRRKISLTPSDTALVSSDSYRATGDDEYAAAARNDGGDDMRRLLLAASGKRGPGIQPTKILCLFRSIGNRTMFHRFYEAAYRSSFEGNPRDSALIGNLGTPPTHHFAALRPQQRRIDVF